MRSAGLDGKGGVGRREPEFVRFGQWLGGFLGCAQLVGAGQGLEEPHSTGRLCGRG